MTQVCAYGEHPTRWCFSPGETTDAGFSHGSEINHTNGFAYERSRPFRVRGRVASVPGCKRDPDHGYAASTATAAATSAEEGGAARSPPARRGSRQQD